MYIGTSVTREESLEGVCMPFWPPSKKIYSVISTSENRSRFTVVLLFNTLKAPTVFYVTELLSLQTFFAGQLEERLVD